MLATAADADAASQHKEEGVVISAARRENFNVHREASLFFTAIESLYA